MGNESKSDIKRIYTVREIQGILNIGKNSAYKLVKSQVFRSVQIGSIIRISKVSFDTWIANHGKDMV